MLSDYNFRQRNRPQIKALILLFVWQLYMNAVISKYAQYLQMLQVWGNINQVWGNINQVWGNIN